MPDSAPPSELYIEIKLTHITFAELVKYVISALGWRPNTSGELIIGISFIYVKNPS